VPTTRRELLHTLGALAALGLLDGCRPASRSAGGPVGSDPCALAPLTGAAPVDASSFRHGVASGDPGADRVMLWTRVEPSATSPGHVEVVEYVLARDPELLDVVATGLVETSAARDFTVKLDVDGLEPGTTYHYRFARARWSPCAVRSMEPVAPVAPQPPILASAIGRTRTLPGAGVERVRLGMCSCSNYPAGFFNVYAALARRDDLDAILHLGDYLYEYADGRYGDGQALGRALEPHGEIVTLADYRARHGLYKRDPDLQAVHAAHPFIAVWDDHELANDAWTGGAQNHDPASQGEWATRLAAAIQAYYEWMPIRAPDPALYRSFRFGELVDLLMLDTRVVGRDRQAPPDQPQLRADPARTLLGPAQEEWLFAGLSASAADRIAWRLLGQQVVFGQIVFDPSKPYNDAWHGYPGARARVLDHIEAEAIADVVVLSGDIHSSWALEVARDPWSSEAREREPILVELVTPAVSSPGPVPPARADELALEFASRHPHLRWVELHSRGYVILDIDRARIQAEWWFMDTVAERRADQRLAQTWLVERGRARLVSPSPSN
jgi:alkaline phosphatase D